METRTRGKGTIDRGLQGSMRTLDDMNLTRLSKQSQGCPLTDQSSGHCYLETFESFLFLGIPVPGLVGTSKVEAESGYG